MIRVYCPKTWWVRLSYSDALVTSADHTVTVTVTLSSHHLLGLLVTANGDDSQSHVVDPMNFTKNALRAASTSRHAMKPATRPRPSSLLRQYATDTPPIPQSAAASGDKDNGIDIPERAHPNAPNLMQPDALMDSADSKTFEPSRRTKFRNSVTTRNDEHSMFEVYRDQMGIDPESLEEKWFEAKDLFDIPLAAEWREGKIYVAPIVVRRVTQQTGKGKMHAIQILVVAGNKNGLLGFGFGKHEDFELAFPMAVKEALRKMDYIERFEDRTIWTEMQHKFGATTVIMRPRPVGFGLRCNPNIYHILKAAGIKDISAKVWGSRNPVQIVHCVTQMLMPGCAPLGMGNGIGGKGKRTDKLVGMQTKDELERLRGRKLVPLRYP